MRARSESTRPRNCPHRESGARLHASLAVNRGWKSQSSQCRSISTASAFHNTVILMTWTFAGCIDRTTLRCNSST